MKLLCRYHIIILILFCCTYTARGQLTGTKTIPGSYATITLAVNALNAAGVGAGGVTFNIAPNYTETIAAPITLTATGTAGNPIVFQRNPVGAGANPTITAYTTGTATPASTAQDGIWRLKGSDYVTINGINLLDNNTANPKTMEYGYALYKRNTTDGCQNVTIKNCTITLNRVNNATGTAPIVDGSAGIIVMNTTDSAATTSLTPTSTAGANSNNKFYSDTIQNCNTGIAIIGYAPVSTFTFTDQNNDIGGSSAATGNTIIAFGGAAAAANPAVAIRTLAQYGLNVSYNTINNMAGTGAVKHLNTLRGIYTNAATSASETISHNTITLQSSAGTQATTGIENAAGATAASNSVIITNNTITNSNTTSSGIMSAIFNNAANPAILRIDSNIVSNNPTTIKAAGSFYSIYNTGAVTNGSISYNNILSNSTGKITAGGLHIAIHNAGACTNLSINNNTIAGDTTASQAVPYYSIYNTGAVVTSLNINSNNLGTAALDGITFTAANSATQMFINNKGGASGCALSISRNNIQGITSTANATGTDTFICNTAVTKSQAIDSNRFIGLNLTTNTNITFITNNVPLTSTGTQNMNYNAIIDTFTRTRGGGTIAFFARNALSPTGAVINYNHNNFSHIAIPINTSVTGLTITDTLSATLSIQNDTFSNWSGGTNGSVTAISANLAGKNNNISNNIINNVTTTSNIFTGITKAGTGGNNITGNVISNITTTSGAVTGITNTAAGNNSITSNTINNINSTAGVFTGITNTSTASGNNTITGNTVSNVITTSGVTSGIATRGTGSNTISGNIIRYISNSNADTGIAASAGTNTISGNIIDSLKSTNNSTGVIGISVSGGTQTISKNRIYTLEGDGTSTTVNGILVSALTGTMSISNNLISDLRVPTSTSTTDQMRGINLTAVNTTSTINVYYNTIYLNAALTTGTKLSTTGIYHTASTTTTTAKLDMRNNIIVNNSTPAGAGIVAAYRRSSSAANMLNNYAGTSNNNLFYCGTADASHLIFYDGTNKDQVMNTYKTRVATRDSLSLSEDMSTKFLSVDGDSAQFLHIDSSQATQVEGRARAIAGYTTDYDGDTRSATAPDMGADEFNGQYSAPLTGAYTVGNGGDFTSLTQGGGLFSLINLYGLSGNVTISIVSDLTEDGTNQLTQWVEHGTGNNYTLTIQPDSAKAYVISGNITSTMIGLNGADRVTFDGSSGGTGSYLTFRNTNTTLTTGSAFTFTNGSINNTIQNCNIEAAANATNGVILFSTSTGTTGNNNNLITNCNINATVGGNTGNACIYSAGTTGKENTNNTISNNNIFNYRDRGLDIAATGSTAWAISGNSFYNGSVSGAITYAAASTLHGIRILGGSGYSILGNYIGGSAALAAGTNASYTSLGILTYQGILLTTTGTNPIPTSNIKGNVVSKVSISATPTSATPFNAFAGIETNGSNINIGGLLSSDSNIVGSNTANTSISILTTTATNTFKTNVIGINCNSTGGAIIGNQVGGVDIKNVGIAPAPSTFYGILASSATAPTLISNNIIGSTGAGAATNSIRVVATSASTTPALIGIGLAATVASTVSVSGNTIQNMSFQSTTAGTGSITGISSAAITPAIITITNDTIIGNTMGTAGGALYGISTSGTAPTVTVSGNLISNNANTAAGAGLLYGILTANTGTTATTTVANNLVSGNTTGVITGLFIGVNNTGAVATLNITGNTFSGNSTTATAGTYNSIANSGIVTTAINITSNNIGTGSGTSSAITYSAANTAAQIGITNTAGGSAAVLKIRSNNFLGVNYSTAGSGAYTLISNTANTKLQNIDSNTFTNLSINTSGNVIFIADSGIVSTADTQTVNANSISGTFTKAAAGGILTLFTSTAQNGNTAIVYNSNNNFSNITVSGVTRIAGWVNTDAGGAIKYIQNNTFSNWTGGTGTVTAISVGLLGSSNITANIIKSISSAGDITGITSGAGNDNIFSNTIDSLSSTGTGIVSAIAITAGTTKKIYKNKIYDLQSGGATGSVNGIIVSGAATTTNIYNNMIAGLSVPAGSSTTDLVRGISITAATVATTINVYYNTIYLNATSTGANFSTTGIFHTSSATATTAKLDLRDNLIANYSTPGATSGIIAAFRRSSSTVTNYATTSNNNLVYAGTPSAKNLLYYDGTSPCQTIAQFKTAAVSPRETASVTENVTGAFLSTAGAALTFLHINISVSTLANNGGAAITGFTDDYDGQTRAVSPLFPDIGADEIFAIETVPPTITYTPLAATTSTANRTLSSVVITDASSINIAAGTRPRIYYKRFSDDNTYVDNTATTNGWKYTETTGTASPFSFTIDYSLLYGGTTVVAGIIQYFVVAQDQALIPNTAINSGAFTTTPASVVLTAAAFPITSTINKYTIPFSGSYNVGTTEIFTSLTKATGVFAAVDSAGLAGNVTFNVTSDLAEDGSNGLNQWTESGVGNYKMVIQPNSATLRTISGNAANGLIRLTGADRVKIDGTNGGSGKYLAFKNTNTGVTTGTAFSFTGGSSNDSIRSCSAEAYANDTNGVVLFGTSTVAGGNSNNVIANCDIIAASGSNFGNAGIYSGGTVGKENSTNIILNNNIYNYRNRGLDIAATGSTAWTISGNNFYNGDVAAASYLAGSTLHGIRILGGSGYTILNNAIGGNAPGASGTNALLSSSGNLSYQGILLTTTSATPASSIKGNTIAHITLTAAPTTPATNTFIGIETNGLGISIGGSTPGDGNTIGSNTANGSIAVNTITTSSANTSIIKGINCNSTGGLIVGNQVGGFDIKNTGAAPAASTFTGIYFNNATAVSTSITSNIIGSTGAGAATNSISVLGPSTALATSLNGIVVGSSAANLVTINANTIKNISNLSTASSGSFTGINNSAAGTSTTLILSNNISAISSVANASTSSTTYTGILSSAHSSITTDTIRNINLPATGTAAQIIGIRVSGAYTHTISNNILASFTTASTKTADIEAGAPSGFNIVGILNEASVAGQVISVNMLSGFNTTTLTATNTAISGIAVTGAFATGNIFSNQVNTFTNTTTGTTTYPGISGIMGTSGTFNVYNNTINIDNGTNTNGVRIYGINHATAGSYNYYYNSIYIGGISNAVIRSAAFLRSVNGTVSIKDNVLVNIRDGNGNDYAISNITSPPATNWASTAADYNNIYSNTAATTGEWGSGVSKTFATWKSTTGGDAHSVNASVTLVDDEAGVQPDSNTNCFLNNKGTPIATPIAITTDINGLTRNGSTPDIGAYEFNFHQFIIHAGSNSPVCAGSVVSLTTDIGAAINPTYSWRDPLFAIVDTTQNPDVLAVAGRYKITVTDVNGCIGTDSTTVALNARPTAHITSSATSFCDGGSVNLNLAVTGTGTISGTTSEGDPFTGTAPLIVVPVSPDSTTTYTIVNLSDNNCTSITTDIPDSVTIKVTHAGDWLGVADNDWNNPANWCGGIPSSATNVTLDTGATHYPVVSSGTANTNDLTLRTGTSLAINNATLDIGGNISSTGTFTATTGTIDMNGSSPQDIPAGLFVGNTIKNLAIDNTSGVTLDSTLNITSTLTPLSGNFNANGYLTLISTATGTALIDGSVGTGSVLGNVTMQRYIPSSFGYKYISSPFQAATVAQLQSYIHLTDSFPPLYQYDESKTSSGWENYTDTNGVLNPLQGYAANFGTSATADTIQLTGVVTNGTVSNTLFNHNQTYTQGFNLVGNPYPSPIDWNASSGLTRTNIDNAVYYFDASATDQYGGIYNSYINGVSSDGVATNIIPAMQGFFVHVSNGTYPVTATLTLDNAARINNHTPSYHRTSGYETHPLVRLTAKAGDDATTHDAMVVYFDDSATDNYDQQLDALKLLNTDAKVPNLYAAPPDNTKLSINAILAPGDSTERIIPLTIETNVNGPVIFSAGDIENMPGGLHPYFADAQANQYKDLETSAEYRVQLQAGKYEHRFYLVFSHDDVIAIPGAAAQLTAYSSGKSVFVYAGSEQGTIVIYNAVGQVVARQDINGKGYHEVKLQVSNGVYIVTLYTEKEKLSKKLFIGN